MHFILIKKEENVKIENRKNEFKDVYKKMKTENDNLKEKNENMKKMKKRKMKKEMQQIMKKKKQT